MVPSPNNENRPHPPTVDDLIDRTEALIAKLRAVKQGLMHDLLTCGVDEHGQLPPPREEAPEL